MYERDPVWDALKALGKKNHEERIAKTPERIKYAISQFEKYDID